MSTAESTSRRLPYLFGDAEKALIRHAISLHHGLSGTISAEDPKADGHALTAIVDEWARIKRTSLNGGPKP